MREVSRVTRGKIAQGVMRNKKAALFEYLLKYRVRTYPNCTVDSITEKGINLWWDAGDPPAKDNVFSFLPADTVVMAVGSEKEDRLVNELRVAGMADLHRYLAHWQPGNQVVYARNPNYVPRSEAPSGAAGEYTAPAGTLS